MAQDNNQTNLIINYLPQTLSDEELQSMFLSIGPVKAAKIVRDKATGYSYGFGFVDYQHEADAERAIQTLNGLQLQNKRIKVALARAGGDVIKGANIYIRNVPKHYQERDLEELFKPFGNVIQSRVLVDLVTNASKGVGFVLFDKKSEAEEAITKMNGKVPPGGDQALALKFADDNAKKVRPPTVPHGMSGSGPRLPGPRPGGPMRNQPGNRFNRYNPMGGNNGYNNYQGNSQGNMMNQGAYFDQGSHFDHGSHFDQGPHFGQGPPSDQGPGHILFCYNIGYDAEEKTLWELFSPFGTVQKVNLIVDFEKKQCKGFGFVTMKNYHEAQNAVDCLNGWNYNGRALQVSFKD